MGPDETSDCLSLAGLRALVIPTDDEDQWDHGEVPHAVLNLENQTALSECSLLLRLTVVERRSLDVSKESRAVALREVLLELLAKELDHPYCSALRALAGLEPGTAGRNRERRQQVAGAALGTERHPTTTRTVRRRVKEDCWPWLFDRLIEREVNARRALGVGDSPAGSLMTPPKEAAELAAEGTLDHEIEVLVLDGRTLLRAVDTAASGPPLRWLVAALELPPGRVANAADRQTIRHQFGLSLLYHADMEEALIALSALLGADLGGHDGIAPFSVTALAQASRDWLLDLHRQPTAGEKQADPRAQAIRDTFRAFQELDTRYGGGHARLALVQYLTTNVLPLLHSGNRGMQGAGAELLYLAGLMAFDDGALGLAERYLIQALRFAQEAGDRAFAANTVAAMSHLAVFAGHGEEASRLARAGLVGLSESEDPAVRMRLLTMEARGHALMGDSPGCAADLSGAETALEEAGSDSEPGWARFLDLAFLAGEMSQCFSDLQQEKLAERFALESIQASNGRGRRRVLSQTTLATSYLRQGKLEQACIAGGQALDLVAGGIRSTRAAYEIRSLAGALEAHGTHPEARAFRDRAREQFS